MEKTWVQKVLEHLKGGDEKKLKKFQKGVIKWIDDQKRIIQGRIEKNKERIEDKEELLDEYVLDIDFNKIQGTDDREKYIEEYVYGYDKIINQVLSLEADIRKDEKLLEKREGMRLKMK